MTNWQRDHMCSMSSGVDLDIALDTTLEDEMSCLDSAVISLPLPPVFMLSNT